MALPTAFGSVEKPKVKTMAINTATVKAPAKLPMNTRPQLRSTPLERDAGALVDQRERREHEHAGEQVEAEQVEHAEADREQDRADERLAGAAR